MFSIYRKVKDIDPIYLLLIIFLLIAGIVYLLHGTLDKSKTIDRVEGNIEALRTEANIYRNESGKWKADALSAQGTIDELVITHQNQLDSVEKYYDVKIKNLETALSAATSTTIDTEIPIEEMYSNDSIELDENQSRLKTFTENKKWYDVTGIILSDKVNLTIDVRDSISFITKWERPKWFKSKRLEVEAISHNPYTKFTSINSINVSASDDRWFVAPVAAYGLGSDFKFQFFVGFGVGYKLFSF